MRETWSCKLPAWTALPRPDLIEKKDPPECWPFLIALRIAVDNCPAGSGYGGMSDLGRLHLASHLQNFGMRPSASI